MKKGHTFVLFGSTSSSENTDHWSTSSFLFWLNIIRKTAHKKYTERSYLCAIWVYNIKYKGIHIRNTDTNNGPRLLILIYELFCLRIFCVYPLTALLGRPVQKYFFIFVQNNLMVAYVHIKYSTYQFSEESKGGGVESNPPPPVLAIPQRAWSWEG